MSAKHEVVVNAHDELVAALRVAKAVLGGCCSCGASVSAIKDIDSAIAKAEGKI